MLQRSKESPSWAFKTTTGKKTYRSIFTSVRPVSHCDVPILRERNRAFSQLLLRSNINRNGPEALNQIISNRGHLRGPDPLDTNSYRALQQFRLGRPVRILGQKCSRYRRARNSFIFVVLMPRLILDPQPPPDREQKNRHHVKNASPLILAHIGQESVATDYNAGLLESRHGMRF
jgi:hypothetical protein